MSARTKTTLLTFCATTVGWAILILAYGRWCANQMEPEFRRKIEWLQKGYGCISPVLNSEQHAMTLFIDELPTNTAPGVGAVTLSRRDLQPGQTVWIGLRTAPP